MVVPYESPAAALVHANAVHPNLQSEVPAPTTSASSGPSPASAAPKRNNTVPSCAVCQRRKVKCDRVYPCAPCQKTGLVCEYKAVHNAGRKRRRVEEPGAAGSQRDGSAQSPPEADATTHVVQGEDGGVRAVSDHRWSYLSDAASTSQSATPAAPSHQHAPQARMQASPSQGISGNSIYESAVSLGAELAGQHGSHDPAPQASNQQRHFMFNSPVSNQVHPSLRSNQPPAHHVVQLWQTYLTNVDPIMKVLHAPTMQQLILSQIGKLDLPAGLQALTSAIYLAAAVSLPDDESKALLSMSRDDLVGRYKLATEEALSNAGFLTTVDYQVMQALVLYLAALRSLGETAAVWSMTGLAIRIGGTMGLDRDGTTLGLSPFECETRRRLWWAIVYLDSRTAEIVGQNNDLLMLKLGVRLPANLNDSQLFPAMQRLPESKPAATEMSYALLRAICATALNDMPGSTGPSSAWQTMRASNVSSAEKARIIDDLEQKMEEEILRFCDATVPLQAFTVNAAQTLVVKMRLVGDVSSDQESRTITCSMAGSSENLFRLCMKMMHLQLELFTDPSLQRWRWHWQGHFQWYAFAELIRQTRMRQPGQTTTKAWSTIHAVVDTIMPTLELPARKCPLLESLRMIFHSATVGTEQHRKELGLPHLAGEQAKTASLAANARNVPTTPSGMLSRANTGARPFTALLPGMSGDLPETSRNDNGVDAAGMNGDGADEIEFDFDSIDWEEFDRLAAGLCSD